MAAPTPWFHLLLLVMSVAGWAVALGGFALVQAFVSDAMGPKSIMSARTFTQLLVLGGGMLLAVLALVGALLAFFMSEERSGALRHAAVISAAQCLLVMVPLGCAAWFGK